MCTEGKYCPTGVSAPVNCPVGTFSNVSGLGREEDCQLCTPGMYCDTPGAVQSTGSCDAGYFCISGVNTSAPIVYSTTFDVGTAAGGVCPAGSYCAVGTSLPTPCPMGTFNNHTGGTGVSACTVCTPGSYCEGTGNSYPTGICNNGYYCSSESFSPVENEAQPGQFAVAGASNYSICAPGTYGSMSAMSYCPQCPAGYYCPDNAMTAYHQNPCPAGHYCPEGTFNPFRCPIGSFTAEQYNRDVSECVACSPGSFCNASALAAPAGDCSEGYYCTRNATMAVQVVITDTGGPCSEGHYCPSGSGIENKCPRGTMMGLDLHPGNVMYFGVDYHCDLCPSGKSCDGVGLATYTGLCDEGYFCKIGAPSATPLCTTGNCTDMYGLCPAGSYCTAGTTDPVPCIDGTFMNHTGAVACDVCPAGHYCTSAVSTSTIFDCPQGFYCPAGTSTTFMPCPKGQYGSREALAEVDDCTLCTPGMYCNVDGSSAPIGNCSAGFYCPEGSINAWGMTTVSGNNTCTAGSYCPAGSALPIACPPGTYNAYTGMSDVTECLYCPPGSYCAGYNETKITGECDAGYYCYNASRVSNPMSIYTDPLTNLSIGGDFCPVGHYCPNGTGFPHQCVPGDFNTLIGQSECSACPAGYFCDGATSFANESNICPVGYYCPEGTVFETYNACPSGTYNPDTQRTTAEDCHDALPGYYASGIGNFNVSGKCEQGYYCPSRANTSTPSCDSSFCLTGGSCVPGEECPEGTGYALPCSPGYYCASNTGVKSGLCDAGHFCGNVSTLSNLFHLCHFLCFYFVFSA